MSDSDFMKGVEKPPRRGDGEWARAVQFKRSALRNGWTTFNVRNEDADEAERRLSEPAPRPDLLDTSPPARPTNGGLPWYDALCNHGRCPGPFDKDCCHGSRTTGGTNAEDLEP